MYYTVLSEIFRMCACCNCCGRHLGCYNFVQCLYDLMFHIGVGSYCMRIYILTILYLLKWTFIVFSGLNRV